jgi:hypothetical protein
MKLTQIPKRIESHIPEPVADFPWTRAIAAGSLVASAYLLFAGRRKTALAIAAAGTAVAVLENPEAVREFWENIPGYVRAGQDLLTRVEHFCEDVAEHGEKLRRMVVR